MAMANGQASKTGSECLELREARKKKREQRKKKSSKDERKIILPS